MHRTKLIVNKNAQTSSKKDNKKEKTGHNRKERWQEKSGKNKNNKI